MDGTYCKPELAMMDADLRYGIDGGIDSGIIECKGDLYYYRDCCGEEFLLDTSKLSKNAKLFLKYMLANSADCGYRIFIDTDSYLNEGEENKNKIFNDLDEKEINILPNQNFDSLVTVAKELNVAVTMKYGITEEIIPVLSYCIPSCYLEVGLNKYFIDCYKSINIFRELINTSLTQNESTKQKSRLPKLEKVVCDLSLLIKRK